jgi:hypothetical protein
MNTPEASFLTWQQQFRTSKDCLHYLKEMSGQMGLCVLNVVTTMGLTFTAVN